MVRKKAGGSRTDTKPETTRAAQRARKPIAPATQGRPRIARIDAARAESMLNGAASLRFDTALADLPSSHGPIDLAAVRSLAKLAAATGLKLLVDIDFSRSGAEWSVAKQNPSWFRRGVIGEWPIDPRRNLHAHESFPRFDHAQAAAGLGSEYAAVLEQALASGVAGFVVHWPQRVPAAVLHSIIEQTRRSHPSAQFIASTPGLNAQQRQRLRNSGFDFCIGSFAWWDFRAPWFLDELDELRQVAQVIAPIRVERGPDLERNERSLKRALETALLIGDGWFLDDAEYFNAPNVSSNDTLIVGANQRFAASARPVSHLAAAPWSKVGAWADGRSLTLINSDLDHHATFRSDALSASAGAAIGDDAIVLGPAEVRRIPLTNIDAIEQDVFRSDVDAATSAPRVMIESITPNVDEGRFAAKRTVGESVVVEADVFSDGHPVLAVRLLWREAHGDGWNTVRMRALGNDRWRAEFPLRRQGLHCYTVEAGIDEFAGLRSGLEKKSAAGQKVALDVEEARLFIEQSIERAALGDRAKLKALARDIAQARDPAARVLAPDCAEIMATASPPAFLTRAPTVYSIYADRRAANFASWYELFPRSQGRDGKSGTLRDVIDQLPRIEEMGFDVLYFPPIHPIGRTNRKGKNNSLNAGPDEPGSPYAIGSPDGGHDALDPTLGTLDDFQTLVAAARSRGLELALDFAVQCSPDHPWIKQHPEWFAWRPDGSMRYAENPPKKYEDIVNVDFYAKGAMPELWLALRDAVAFWMNLGVKIFRVDNPHTKPLPFWEWLIADLKSIDPDVLFLAEAFTRPKLMNRLAKLGFSQSYTYFTWRNTRDELETYLKQLNAAPVRDFFRPNFFVNTPDINPYFLHDSGRPGFLIRAALATTLSGLWGMYSGFELCESAAFNGKEEYLDSEKYELRPRDWHAPGNIAAEIAQLNRIRRANPALQTHLGVAFYTCSNSNIVYFGKATPARDNVILVAVSLDPHHAQEADIELPLWEFGLDDNGLLLAEDLLDGHSFDWRGKHQHIRLEPEHPYRIWRVRTERDR